jgi:hypothetical protein
MDSEDKQPANGDAPGPYYIMSGEEINRIIVPLTVVHAYTQLLRRRIRQKGEGGIVDLDQALAYMEEATRTMAAELWATLGATSHPRRDTD